jgi:hypothetical protein
MHWFAGGVNGARQSCHGERETETKHGVYKSTVTNVHDSGHAQQLARMPCGDSPPPVCNHSIGAGCGGSGETRPGLGRLGAPEDPGGCRRPDQNSRDYGVASDVAGRRNQGKHGGDSFL